MIKVAASSPIVAAAPIAVAALPPPAGSDGPGKPHSMSSAPLSAAEAAREARAAAAPQSDRHVEADGPPTTRVVRASVKAAEAPARTQLVRGKMQVKRGAFDQDPVVGWLVIVGGPGIGQFRPVFEGNNTIGRAATNRVSLDFASPQHDTRAVLESALQRGMSKDDLARYQSGNIEVMFANSAGTAFANPVTCCGTRWPR